jgi:hypothetical protein
MADTRPRRTTVAALESLAPTAPEVATYQARLRLSVFNAVGEDDVARVVKGIIDRAAAGDAKALTMFWEFLIGGMNPHPQLPVEPMDRDELELRIKRERARGLLGGLQAPPDDDTSPSAATIEKRLRARADAMFADTDDD